MSCRQCFILEDAHYSFTQLCISEYKSNLMEDVNTVFEKNNFWLIMDWSNSDWVGNLVGGWSWATDNGYVVDISMPEKCYVWLEQIEQT